MASATRLPCRWFAITGYVCSRFQVQQWGTEAGKCALIARLLAPQPNKLVRALCQCQATAPDRFEMSSREAA